MIEDSWTLPHTADVTDLVNIAGLVVDYDQHRALDCLNLRVPPGEIFGLLGANGAGKTTLFRVLATLLAPTAGDIRLCGRLISTHRNEIRANLAYMPDMAPLPSDLRASEYLAFFAGSYGLRGTALKARVIECLEAVGLADRSKDVCTELSLGMRQRLALAKAILHRPQILILDEPASGLDPAARFELRETLRQQAQRGATVILSSHVMSDIQDLCTSIGFLHKGRLLDAGPVRQVLARFGNGSNRVLIHAPGNRDRLAMHLETTFGIKVEPRPPGMDSVEILLDVSKLSCAELFSNLGEARLGVTGMQLLETSIEEVVLRLSRKEEPR